MATAEHRFLGPRAAALLALARPALAGDPASQHKFRVAARSLRADLDVLLKRADRREGRKVRRALGRAIRSLADVRDLDVGRALMTPSPLQVTVEGRLAKARQVALKECARSWPKDLGTTLQNLVERSEPRRSTMRKRAGREVRRQRRRALELLRSSNRFDPVRCHDLRKAIRSLRYAMQLLNDLKPRTAVRVDRLEALQDALGAAQDHIVLSGWLGREAKRLPSRDHKSLREITEARAHHRDLAAESWAKFQDLHPRRVVKTQFRIGKRRSPGK